MGTCLPGYEESNGLCYIKCNDGYTGVGNICYKNCPDGLTDAGNSCTKPAVTEYGRGSGHFTEAACKTSGDHGASTNGCQPYGLWYPKCDPGFNNVGCCLCSKPCPEAYGRGAGHETQATCLASGDHGASTNGCEKYGLLWYPICDKNFENTGCCICSPICPPDYGRGTGHETEAACKASGDHGASTNGCEQYGLWYPICDPGFNNDGCCICEISCPDGWVDTGTACTKPNYNRGQGITPPAPTPTSSSYWELWVFIGGLVVIIIVGVIIFSVVVSKRARK